MSTADLSLPAFNPIPLPLSHRPTFSSAPHHLPPPPSLSPRPHPLLLLSRRADRRGILRRTSPISMSCHSTDRLRLELSELNDESDFEKLLTPGGRISICGFGSLLSERSARSTFPDLADFRVARLDGFRRVFAHVAPIFFERGIAKLETKEISSLSVEPCDGETLVVTVFEIEKSEIPAFMRRELEFRFVAVMPKTLDGEPFENLAVCEFCLLRTVGMAATCYLAFTMSVVSLILNPIHTLSTVQVLCARYSDEEFFRIRCRGSKEIYFQHYGRYNIDKIWRDDVLPCRVYLRHCVLAAKNLGDVAHDNFLDHTYLADRKTTIRKYLETTGSGIMEEEPPESLRTRYGG